ncbi:MAG: NERD domain-containing protein [Mollicutes bacterium PWAP]|nr:NERD domain-containing protein [Mollicutes bacterium PWAP]
MKWYEILPSVIGILLVVAAIILVFVIIFKRKNIDRTIKKFGKDGEEAIGSILISYAKENKGYFIKPTILAYNKNKVYEIDGILITDRATFIVEIKNISGHIYGDAKDKMWVKKMGESHFDITNAILQNEKHLKHYDNMLKGMKSPLVSLVVFTNRARTCKINNIPQHVLLLKEDNLWETLTRAETSLPKVRNKKQSKELKNFILENKANNSQQKLHKKITRGK